ncbi:UNVERIFIED_CONTAM: hypothetical protein GTU68_047944 [Idotea baltica]|nr:hypothetical protein [Idotea baltica]
MSKLIKLPFVAIIKFYRIVISPLLPSSCRFYPTCSNYALEVLGKFGIFRALFLIVKRICKCNPFSKGGIDLP